ncbi:TSA1-like protein [Brassica rapa]|uniref:TSA1-like protein n=1 Tax=Brassica campestris TaxID=3711 RepID=UPI000872DC80|nr:TSA1-like protein [Brassica rapa]
MCSVFIDERGRDPQVKERAETDISVPHAPVRAATKGLGEQKASDSTEGKDHDDHLASRKSMLMLLNVSLKVFQHIPLCES